MINASPSSPCLGRRQGPSFILSGGADGEVCVWGPMEVSSFGRAEGDRHLDRDEEVVGRYKCKQRLTGHHRSAVCVSSGRLEVVTGHEDGEPQHFFINVLASCPLARASAPTPRKWRAASFEGTHELGCLRTERFREADIASTTTGTVIVWWTATGMITMKSKVHSGPVRQLQFDATKVCRDCVLRGRDAQDVRVRPHAGFRRSSRC